MVPPVITKRDQKRQKVMQSALPLLSVSCEPPEVPSLEWRAFRSHLGNLEKDERHEVQRAFQMGLEAHAGQVRLSGEPFFAHCITIAMELARVGADSETIIAALLHDTVEDTPVPLSAVREAFGDKVAYLIDGVTRLTDEQFIDQPSHDARIETLRKIFTFMQEDIRIIVIKLFDRLHNMETINALSPDRQKVMAEETLQVYTKVASQLCMKKMRDRLEFLSLRILKPNIIERLIHEQTHRYEEELATIKHIEGMMQTQTALRIDVDFFALPLHWMRLLSQFENEEVIEKFPLSISIVTPSIEDCYRTLYLLHRLWRREVRSFEDFINAPQLNGYQGLHTTVILQDGRRVRCMIRTSRMDRYAHEGILTSCFTESGTDPLGWLASTLTVTKGLSRSEEFWTSLQSDILGESMLVHGPGDRVVMLPKGSTVLDAAFYFYQNDALRSLRAKVNGRTVPFSHPVRYADTVEINFANRTQVTRKWLDCVHTGVAIAKIRTALTEQSRDQKIDIGKHILQDVMTEKSNILLGEYHEEAINQSLKSIGFSSLDDAFIAIAEGKADPDEMHNQLFVQKSSKFSGRKRMYVLGCVIEDCSSQAMSRFFSFYYSLREQVRSFRISSERNVTKVRVLLSISEEQADSLRGEIHSWGMENVFLNLRLQRLWQLIAIILPLFIWGMDVVLVKVLLEEPFLIPSIDFTILRFIGFFFFTALYAFFVLRRTSVAFERITLKDSLIWISALSLVCVALTMYEALQYLLPHEYSTIAIANAVTIILFNPFYSKKIPGRSLLYGVTFVALGLVLVPLVRLGELSMYGYGMGLLSLVFFSTFSVCVDQFKERHGVHARYPVMLFIIAIIALIVSVFLIPFSSVFRLGLLAVIPISFGFFLNGVPYILYYQFVRTENLHYLVRAFPVCVIIAALGQFLIFGSFPLVTLLPFVFVAGGGIAFHWLLAHEKK